jgi:hypothetical protein
VGDARLDYSKMTYDWFDHFLKGEKNDVLEAPEGAVLHDGQQQMAVVRVMAAGREPNR